MRTLQFTTFFVLFQTAAALQCYTCSKCNDPFVSEGTNVGTCSYSCVKIKALADGNEVGIKEGDVERGCLDLYGLKLKEYCLTLEFDVGPSEVCFCNGDNCNGGNGFQVSIATATMATVITIFKNII